MDDDIRSRFRGVRSRSEAPSERSVRPMVRPRPQPAQPAPINQPTPSNKPQSPSRPKVAPKTRRKSKGRAKKFFLVIFVLLLLSGGAAGAYVFMENRKKAQSGEESSQTTQPETEPKTPQPTGTIRLVATGDFAAYDSINTNAKTGSTYNYAPMMSGIKPFLSESDISICGQASLGAGTQFGISGYPDFNAPTEWSKAMQETGCRVINLASNNTNDKGQAAIDAAVKYWDSQKDVLAVSGANNSAEKQKTIRYFSIKQVKFAFLSYVVNSDKPLQKPYGVNVYSDTLAKSQITEARKNAQFVIVGMSWGKEDSAAITPEQSRIAGVLASVDADLVIGNGTHTVQTAKVFEGKEGHQSLVFFSLGNFINSQLPIENLVGGLAAIDIDVATQNIKDPSVLPVYMHYEWTAAQKAAGELTARKNFKLLPLDKATSDLARSLNGTTVKAQTDRIKAIYKGSPIKVITSAEF